MKENSIERDIHLLESYAGMTHKMTDNQGRPKLDQAIEHILRDYKRVLKENEELLELKVSASAHNRILELEKENEELKKFITEGITVAPHSTYKNYRLDFLRENFVSKKKIKDKIEELNRKIDKSIDNSKGGLDEEFIEKAGELLTQKRILQELLEGRE